MTQLFVFSIADAREVPPTRGNILVRTLEIIHDWNTVDHKLMRDPETITALFRLVKAARRDSDDHAPFIPHSALVRAVGKCAELAGGLYAGRDGGPYAMVLGNNVKGLKGLEKLMKYLPNQKWHDAKYLARSLAELKRHLR